MSAHEDKSLPIVAENFRAVGQRRGRKSALDRLSRPAASRIRARSASDGSGGRMKARGRFEPGPALLRAPSRVCWLVWRACRIRPAVGSSDCRSWTGTLGDGGLAVLDDPAGFHRGRVAVAPNGQAGAASGVARFLSHGLPSQPSLDSPSNLSIRFNTLTSADHRSTRPRLIDNARSTRSIVVGRATPRCLNRRRLSIDRIWLSRTADGRSSPPSGGRRSTSVG